MEIRVMSVSDDETEVAGQLTRNGRTHPFTGKVMDDDEVERVKGSFIVDGREVGFVSSQDEDDDFLTFRSEGKTVRLLEVAPTELPMRAVEKLEPKAKTIPQGKAPATAANTQYVRMRKAEFRDVNMGNVVAYTMLVPDGWQTTGHIEWSNDRTPYPQRKISVTAPDQSRISFIPTMSFHYAEATQLALNESAAMGKVCPIPKQQGTPPPQRLGEWLVSLISQTDKTVSRLKLVSDQRDTADEAAFAAQYQAIGQTLTGQWQSHLVTISFELGGVPFTQEFHLRYARNPAVYTRNMNTWTWLLFVESDVRAPSAKFAAMKPLLYASSRSLRSDPRWWTQQQWVIMETTRRNHAIGMEQIRKRGEYYNQMSDANFAAWKKREAASDSQQNDRINSIYEVSDFRDTDGLGVKLPIHYQNHYSDGKGNYIMSNSTLDEPGAGWTKLEAVK